MASNIRVNSNPTGNIHINANDERPRYAGYTITAERSQTEHGTLITAEDWRGITESMVYDGVGIETLVYNDDFTVTITLMDGRTFTTEDTVARGVDQAESAAEHALESQRAALASEEAAAESATQSSAAAGSALAYANRAETAATAASTYANRANASAESIDGILEAVTALEASTTQKANEARDYATQASGAASTATTKAAEAGQSASSAATDASRAENYKTDALNAKAAAETAADNAEASETSANASAVEASTYASNASASATASATSASEAEASAQAAAQSAATVYSLLPADTASGDIASFPDGANAIPMDYLKVQLEPIQDLHGYDKPWSGGAGKNKYNPANYIVGTASHYNLNVGEVLSQGGGASRATSTGENPIIVDVKANWTGVTYISDTIKSGQEYCLSFSLTATTSANCRVSIYYISDNYEVLYRYANYTTPQSILILLTPTEDCRVAVFVGSTTAQAVTVNNLQLELGSSATSYEPYSNICPISGHTEVVTHVSPTTSAEDGTTYTTPLGQTVYGGTLDIVSGELVVDRAMVDMGDLNWSYYGSVFYVNLTDKVSTLPSASDIRMMCSNYAVVPRQSVMSPSENGIIYEYAGGNPPYSRICVRDDSFNGNVADFKTASSGQTIVYELATPQTYQLTPQEVRTLLGTNNVWSDGVYHPLVKRYLKDNSWVGKYVNGVMYYVNNGYGYLHTDTFKDASVSCSHFAVKKFVPKPTDTSTPLADNGLYLTDDGSLYARYDAVEDADPTVSLQNWMNFVTSNNVYLTVPSYSDTASDSLEVELVYRADVALWVERKLHE